MSLDVRNANSSAIIENEFEHDVLAGLAKDVDEKSLPSRYLYDERGCELFEQICETPEYYPTRTELAIMQRDAKAMASVCGPGCRLVELGSGSSTKTQLLLDEMDSPALYVPVDIAPDYLGPSVRLLRGRYPDLPIEAVCANFTQPFEVPDVDGDGRTVIYFPGSTIGNLHRADASALIARMREMSGPWGGMLVGMDLKKDVAVLEAAYNDRAGVTENFTHNLLTRLKRELSAEIQSHQFEHLARYNAELGRIEIYLCSTAEQTIRIGDHCFALEEGELINTEYSYKYSLADAQQMAHEAGCALTHAWFDKQNWFGIFFFDFGT